MAVELFSELYFVVYLLSLQFVFLIMVVELFRELSSLVDRSWKMEMGGSLKEEPLPV